MKNNKQTDLQTKFSLILDSSDQLLHCGNRFENTNDILPILIPKNCDYTEKLIKYYHKILLHSGVSLTLSMIRKNYWIIQGRQAICKILNKCSTCKKIQGHHF